MFNPRRSTRVPNKRLLKNARTEIMGDPEAVRLMRATHVKEPA